MILQNCNNKNKPNFTETKLYPRDEASKYPPALPCVINFVTE
jgi:hypothetical protein